MVLGRNAPVFCYPLRMNEQTTAGPVDAAAALGAAAESLRECRGCGLCETRTQVVFGVGSPSAPVMFVGEAPGFHEDRQGEPFVGQAGKLLNTLLAQIGLTRADVYIANVVKCRPPENRDPTPEEIETCSPHLMEQIAIIRPAVICTLGRFAAKLLTGTELSMTNIHGKAKPMNLGGVDLVVFPVFHPAAALYAPANRVVLEEDFTRLQRLLERGLAGASAAAPVPERVEDCASPGGEADVRAAPPPPPSPPPPSLPATGEQLPLW